ncbi:MAG: DUF4136 domain-containing protein [Bdellovibrionales bacterium]
MRTLVVSLLCLFLLSGCVSGRVRSMVSRFHDPDNLHHESYVFAPTKHQENNLEYKHYRGLLSKALKEQGFIEVKDKQKAAYIVTFQYGIDGQSEVVSTFPIFRSTGGKTVHHDGHIQGNRGFSANYSGTSYTLPKLEMVGTRTSSVMEYHRFFNLGIALKNKKTKGYTKVFEGRVKSKGTDITFSNVSRCLIQAMFKDFPGINGKSDYVVIPADKCMGSPSIYLD